MKRFISFIIAVMCLTAIVAAAEEYDLASYLALVERNNPDILLAYKNLELSNTGVAMARSAFLPSAGVQGGYNRNLLEQSQSMAVASTGQSGPLIFQDVRSNFDNELTLGIGVNQMIFSASAISNFNKAKVGRAIQEQSYEAVRLAVLSAAKKLYARAQLANLVVQIRESSERLSLEQYERVQRRHQVGAAIELDLLSAEVDWLSKSDAVIEARKNAELALIALRNLAGIPHSQTISLTEKRMDDLPAIPEAMNLGAVLAGRADYRALLLARDLAEIDRRAARGTFFPEVSASFSYALGYLNGNSDVPSGNHDFNSASFGIRVNIPISTGGARIARMDAARLEQERANIALWQRETAIESELYELQLRLSELQRRIDSSFRTVETATRAVALAQSAFSNGQATNLTVVDAQDRLDLVWLNFAFLGFEYLSAYYDYELSLGLSR